MSDKNRPHILIIIMDTTRHNHLSCYGHHRHTTPNIDKIAQRGVIFEQAITTSTWTLPTHASILTGMYSSKHGAHNQKKMLGDKYVTLPEFLAEMNYKSALFSNNPFVSNIMGLSRGFDTFEELWLKKGLQRLQNNAKKLILKTLGKHDKGAAEINTRINKWLKSNINPDMSSFIFVNYLEPHLEYQPPKPFDKLYLPKDVKQSDVKKINQDYVKYISKQVQMTPKDFEILTALYDAEIFYLDKKIGQIIDKYEKLNILDDTIVIITADHGENIGEHEMMGHEFSLSENILRIPLIIRYPKIFKEPAKVSHPVQLVDIFSTIVDILDVENSYTKTELQGKSLVPEKLQKLSDRYTITELFRPKESAAKERYSNLNLSKLLCDFKAIRYQDYKYIWSSNNNFQLYNLKSDPSENNNLIESEKSKVFELQQKLEEWQNTFEVAYSEANSAELDNLTKDRLRSLGYID